MSGVPRTHTACAAGDGSPRAPVSVVILTLNEEQNIAACLGSCAWCDDVHVLDSGSTDRTGAIAGELGAGVHVHPFESFGKQRNWAIDHIPLKHDWVFHLDADERFTPELVREIDGVLRGEPELSGFYVPSKLMFMGRWLRRAGGFPTYQMRLFHRARTRFIDYGHGQREEPGKAIGTLRQPYLHYSFSKGLADWIDKHNRYSTQEAREIVRILGERGGEGKGPGPFGSAVQRRRWLKERVYPRLPARWVLRFCWLYFVKLGFLDGRAGLRFCQLYAAYELFIGLKVRECEHRARGGTT